MVSVFASIQVASFLAFGLPVIPEEFRDDGATPDAEPIIPGGVVPECAWPTVVELYTSSGGRCSGVYVGGRIVLTAAHCIPVDFVIPNQLCTTDSECPDVSSLNGAVSLECDPGGFLCKDPDPLISNKIVHAQFGSEYDHSTAFDGDLPRKSIQIAYCRQVANIPAGGMGTNSNDFGYCVLTDEPNLQAIPISAPCENAAELLTGAELFAVGFGQSEASEGTADSGGTKRWATTTLWHDDWANQTKLLQGSFDWTSEGGIPVELAEGDSGGPLFAHMSDGTWRVIGIAQTGAGWGIPFHHINWLDLDPNIAIEDVLPCHDLSGQFVGGPNCDETPATPNQPSGNWERGDTACFSSNVVQYTNLCPPMMMNDGPSLSLKAPESLDEPPTPAVLPGLHHPRESAACSVWENSSSSPFSKLLILGFCLFLFRRRV